jgi:hypothetical protein
MRVLLDELPCDVRADSVGEAITAASALAENDGRMIIEVVVDGEPWTAQHLESDERRAQSAVEIRLTSADPMKLVAQTFSDASRALTDASQFQQRAAELLQTDRLSEAMRELHEAIAIWIAVQQALTMGLDLAEIDPDQPAFEDLEAVESVPTITILITRLQDRLTSVHDALKTKDTVAVADVLLYEMPPVVAHWQDMLESLQSRLSEADGKS